MEVHYTSDEMDTNIEEHLLERQAVCLELFMKKGREKAFEEVLGRYKTGDNSGQIADEWEFIHYEDAGKHWRKNSSLYCECGRKLRYQYTLRNKTTGLMKCFGLNHLTEHTGIQPEYARQIVKKLLSLERERSEIVKKWTNHWTLETAGITRLPAEDKIPEDISWHLSHKVPLLERQLKQLRELIREEQFHEEEKRLQQIVAKEKQQLKEDGQL
ncbi:MAG TPA: hypothetical protein VK144_05815 [Bacillota bacterium]|nr:hypothetical protein [Bacillota bacterium]